MGKEYSNVYRMTKEEAKKQVERYCTITEQIEADTAGTIDLNQFIDELSIEIEDGYIEPYMQVILYCEACILDLEKEFGVELI